MSERFINPTAPFNAKEWHEKVSRKIETIREVYQLAFGEAGLNENKRGVIVDYGCGSGFFLRIILNTLQRNQLCFGVDSSVLALPAINSVFENYLAGMIKPEKNAVEGALQTDVTNGSKAFVVYGDSKEFAYSLPENSVDVAFCIFPGVTYSVKIPGLNDRGNRLIEDAIQMKMLALLFCKTMYALKPEGKLITVFGVRALDRNAYMNEMWQRWNDYGIAKIPYYYLSSAFETEHVVKYIEEVVGTTATTDDEKQWIVWVIFTKDDNKQKRGKNVELLRILEKDWGNIEAGIERNNVRAVPKENKVEIGRFQIIIMPEGFVRE